MEQRLLALAEMSSTIVETIADLMNETSFESEDLCKYYNQSLIRTSKRLIECMHQHLEEQDQYVR